MSASETWLGQVFLSLIVNAAQAMKPRGGAAQRLTLTTGVGAEGMLQVEGKDTGGGMSPHVAARMFEPFFTTKDPGVGTGLGLSIWRTIVEEQGGLLGFDTELGVGTTFRLSPAAGREPPRGQSVAAGWLPPRSTAVIMAR